MKYQHGDPAVSAEHPLETGLLITGVFAFAVIGSAWISVILTDWLRPMESAWAQAILEKGPHKLMRRVMIVLAVPFVPYLLRRAGWRGWRDCGWSRSTDRRVDDRWGRDVSIGIAAGLLTLGMVSILQIVCGGREWTLQAEPMAWVKKLASIIVAAILIGCLEETLVRGILFRVLERLWKFWPAALFSSVLFAYGHYLEAEVSAFGGGGILEQTGRVVVSTITNPSRTDHFLVNVINLTLMGFVLCTVVYRTRTVWMAVGLHASWVALIKFNFYTGDAIRDAVFSPWIGKRADATDAVVTSFVLVLLAGWAFVALPMRGESKTSA